MNGRTALIRLGDKWMTDYIPPLDTGLRGDAYVEVQLRQFVNDLSDAHTPGVYCLRLSKPPDLRAAWDDAYDAMHPEIDAMQSADRLYYVGAAKNVFERIEAHRDGEQSAAVMEAAPPHSVAQVWFYDDVDRAFERESMHAITVGNKAGNYVVQN